MTQEQAQQQSTFEGWAIVEIFGHQRYAGFVSTQVFGTACMFRIDVPALMEREEVTTRPTYSGEQYLPAGTKVKLAEVQGYTKLFGVGAIYGMTPCTEAAATKAVEGMQSRPLMVIDLPSNATKALPPGAQESAMEETCATSGRPCSQCECEDCADANEDEFDV